MNTVSDEGQLRDKGIWPWRVPGADMVQTSRGLSAFPCPAAPHFVMNFLWPRGAFQSDC